MSSILIVAISPIDRSLLNPLVEPLTGTFGERVEVSHAQTLEGSFAFNVSRNQYGSTPLISALFEKFEDFDGRILGVTSGDLFVPVLTYVFGEAQLSGKVAVVSSHRLNDELYGLGANRELLRLRLLKECIHELGHTFGLLHCNDYLCVMHSSTGVEEIDVKTERLCKDCRSKLSAHTTG
ncbi:MAG: archaemetzincin family Zn-dependent metalloprotease [Bacteroidetes bacterium]|nr:archaemetzincin family Zn-dependent metalloprotease [Bacteroidota bacterium]